MFTKVFLRAPREWMKLFAQAMGFTFQEQGKQMFQKPDNIKGRVKDVLVNYYKSSSLPPIEWLVNYDGFFKVPNDSELIIEPGSKLIKTKNRYICYVENGLGLFSFNTKKINFFNKYFFIRKLKEINFKGFVFYSKAARLSTESLFKQVGCEELFNDYDLGIIYPFTPSVFLNNSHVEREIKFIFCSSSFNLKGGRELLRAFELVRALIPVQLVIITNINELSFSKKIDGVKFVDFKLTSAQYIEQLKNADVLVHPTLFDTHALSLLEAVNLGLPAITTNTFALPEFVKDGFNGRIIANPYSPYKLDCSPNFKGQALSYAKEIANKKDISVSMVMELSEVMLDICNNLSFYKNNARLWVENKELSQGDIKSLWGKVIAEANAEE